MAYRYRLRSSNLVASSFFCPPPRPPLPPSAYSFHPSDQARSKDRRRWYRRREQLSHAPWYFASVADEDNNGDAAQVADEEDGALPAPVALAIDGGGLEDDDEEEEESDGADVDDDLCDARQVWGEDRWQAEHVWEQEQDPEARDIVLEDIVHLVSR